MQTMIQIHPACPRRSKQSKQSVGAAGPQSSLSFLHSSVLVRFKSTLNYITNLTIAVSARNNSPQRSRCGIWFRSAR